MASKLVTDRQKIAEAVVAIGRAQGAALTSSTQQVLSRARPELASLDVGRFIDGLMGAMERARDEMITADETHERELGDDPGARAARDAAAAELNGQLVELREVVTGLYGQATVKSIMAGETPRDPVVLERFAGEVAANLSSKPLGEARIKGASIDPNALAAQLESARKNLSAALAKVATEAREHDATLVSKNAALDNFDRIYQGVANTLTGLFLLSGENELADRVRPPSRGVRASRGENEPITTA